MRLLQLTLRGVTTFTETISIDFEALGPGLIAVQGSNGTGKSTILEASAVALWKAFPSRPGFYENFQGRDAFIEATFSEGVTVRISVDAVKRTTEGYVFVGGVPVTDGKSANFGASIDFHFGSFPLFLASVFACQSKKGSFLGLVKAERKDLFVELLGIGTLQVLSESARQQKVAAESAQLQARAKVEMLDRLLTELAGSENHMKLANSTVELLRSLLLIAKDAERDATDQLARCEAAAKQREALAATARNASLAALAADRWLDACKAKVPAAQKARDERRREVAARQVGKMELTARIAHEEERVRIYADRAHRQKRLAEIPSVEDAQAAYTDALSMRDAVAQSQARAQAERQASKDAERNLVEASKAHTKETERAEGLKRRAEKLNAVPCATGEHGWCKVDPDDRDIGIDNEVSDLAGTCPLIADARDASLALPALLETLSNREEINAAQKALFDANLALEQWDGVDLDQTHLNNKVADAKVALAVAKGADDIRKSIADLDVAETRNDDRLANGLRLAEDAKIQAAHDALRIEEAFDAEVLSSEASTIEAEKEAFSAHAALLLAGEAVVSSEDVSLDEARSLKVLNERARLESEEALRRADIAHASAMDAWGREAALKVTAAEASTALAYENIAVGDWALLEKSLGREGVQALEIDAAGPEVATLANELLHACYGPRFSLTLETLAEKRDGGMKEVFDIRVFDGGSERAVEALSGGEKVVVGEALGLSLAIYNAKKNNVRWETLWRDETAGALDPQNAQAYVQMLRRARELGGFHQIVFVAHQTEVWEAADAIIHVADGKVSTS